MFPDPTLFLLLVLIGGLVALDGAGCGQFMVSRPFVAASLGGLLVGAPVAGAGIGLVLEAFHLTVLPVGAATYPDSGPPALASGALFALSGGGIVAVVTTTTFFLGWSWLAGETVHAMRRMNVPVDPSDGLAAEQLQRRHLAALGVDLARGMLLVAAGIVVLGLMLFAARAAWGAGERVPQLVVDAAVAGLLASVLRLLGGSTAAFGLGLAGGLLLLLVTR